MHYTMKYPIKKLEERIFDLEKRVSQLEHIKPNSYQNEINSTPQIESIITSNIDKLGMQDIVILALYSKPKQTVEDLREKIKLWGGTKQKLNWFAGGNLKQRLVDTGILFEDGKNKNGLIEYSVTKGKGYNKVNKILQKLENQKPKK